MSSSDASGLPAPSALFDNEEALAAGAEARFVEAVRSAPGPLIAICLSGGGTPRRLYERIGRRAGDLPWSRLHWFLGDERFVPPDHPDSNLRMVREAMLSHAPPANVHPVATMALGLAGAAEAYERDLKAFYGSGTFDPARPLFDLVILGIGIDGHTASLFPGRPALDERAGWVVGVEEADQPPFVPRVTLTIPALGSARSAMVLASGREKHEAIARIAAGEALPTARVAAAARAEWLIDRPASTGGAA